MPDEYAISDLTLSSGITNNDLMELATPDQSSETGYSSVSATVVMLATKMLKNIQFTSDLNTTDKTIIGAINEILASGGASIMYGTTAPTAQQGSNGNLYVQYTAGTGGASDTVDALFVKLDGAWCEIATGGGTGSTTLADLTDTQITSPADKEVLQYDGTAQKWKNKSTSIEKTIQNVPIATFPDGADNVPVKELKVDIDANLSGVSSVNVTRCGKNLLPNEITTTTEKQVTFTTESNGKITISGISSGSIFQTDICENFSLPIGSYIFSYDAVTNVTVQICNRAENVSYLQIDANNTSKTLNVTSAMVDDMRVRFIIDNGKTVNGTTGVMVRLASESETTFEAYNGTTYTIDFSSL